MVRVAAVIVAMTALWLLVFGRPSSVSAQNYGYVLDFYSATHGADPGNGVLQWCDTRYYDPPAPGPHFHGGDDAIDEQERWNTGCQGAYGFWGELLTWGLTTAPASSWYAAWAANATIYSGQYYPDLCDYTEVRFYGYYDGLWRGTERFIHTEAVNYSPIVIYAGLNSSWTLNGPYYIAGMTKDSDCQGGAGWSTYHIHQGYLTACGHLHNNNIGFYNSRWGTLIHEWWWTENIAC